MSGSREGFELFVLIVRICTYEVLLLAAGTDRGSGGEGRW